VADVDEFAELFDSEVQRILAFHAPLRSGRRRSGKNDTRQLSDEARRAKQLRRRLERRYRRTGLESDRRAYQAACTTARDRITRDHALTKSSHNSTKSPVIPVLPGDGHRVFCTPTTRSSTMTPSVPLSCRRSVAFSSTRWTASATT